MERLERLPAEVLQRVLACLSASSVAAAAVTHPALAAAARTLPELSHVRLRLALQPGGSPQPGSQGGVLRCDLDQAYRCSQLLTRLSRRSKGISNREQPGIQWSQYAHGPPRRW